MTILSAIADIRRFASAKKLVGYAGLGAKVHTSGHTHRSGGITKQGRKELPAIRVEAACACVLFATTNPGANNSSAWLFGSVAKRLS